MNNVISIIEPVNKTNKLNPATKALIFANTHGIVSYKLFNNHMVYYVSYPQYLANKRYTIKCVVDLKDMTEKREQLKRYNSAGEYNN